MVNRISWQSDGQRKIAVSYSNLEFNSIVDSLVWDIGKNKLFYQSDFYF